MGTMNFKNISKGILLSVVISLAAMGVLSVFVFFMNISDKTVSTFIFALTAISVFIGAFVLAKNIDSRGLLNGLLLAVGYFAVLLILSLAINGGISFDSHNLLRLVSILAAGMLGGVLGINS